MLPFFVQPVMTQRTSAPGNSSRNQRVSFFFVMRSCPHIFSRCSTPTTLLGRRSWNSASQSTCRRSPSTPTCTRRWDDRAVVFFRMRVPSHAHPWSYLFVLDFAFVCGPDCSLDIVVSVKRFSFTDSTSLVASRTNRFKETTRWKTSSFCSAPSAPSCAGRHWHLPMLRSLTP